MSDAQPTATPDNANNNPPANFKLPKWFNFGNLTAIFSVLTLFFTVSGFFVVQNYLASLTFYNTNNIFTYNINFSVYISAGVNLLLGIIWVFLRPIIPPEAIPSLIVFLITLFILFWSIVVDFLKQFNIFKPKSVITRVIKFVFVPIIVSTLTILPLAYGSNYYSKSPRVLGGGQPTPIILVFDEAQTAPESVWGFPINPANPRQSAELQLLMELTDGYLVRHGDTGVVVMVKGDAIQGVIYR